MTRVQHAAREQKDAGKGEQITESPTASLCTFTGKTFQRTVVHMCCSAISVLVCYNKNKVMHLNPLLCSQMMTANCVAALQRHESVYTKSETEKTNDQNTSKNKHKPQKKIH